MMNERLTKLYRSCRTKEALASQDEYKSSNMLLGLEVEKFALLIIRECVGVVGNGSFLHDQAPTAIFARECSDAIKQYFEIEI